MKKTITDYTYKDKKVIIRCDLNVPIENGTITDDTRIKASLKSINYLLEHEAKLIIMSHLGKVKTEEDKKNNTLYPVYLKLKEYLKYNIYFSKTTRGEELEAKINSLNSGEALLIENTRYEDYPDKLESSCDENLSKYWSSLGEIFINDAYGTSHRAHASNVGIAKNIPNGLGFLVENEVSKLSSIMEEKTTPLTIIMGGKKVSDKTLVIDNLIKKCDYLLLGGGMCFTFLKALDINVGNSIIDEENIEYCKKIIKEYKDKIILPIDFITKENKIIQREEFNKEDIGYDIGPKTIELFKKYITQSKRVIINGPMGVFEEPKFANGTIAIFKMLKDNNIKTLIGGGDSAAAVNLLGFDNSFYHISTGGGATLEYLGGKSLPAIDIIEDK